MKAPNLNDDQSLTFELLMILGLVLILISPLGQWLAGIVQEIATHHDFKLTFNPLDKTSTTFHSTNQPVSSGGSNAPIGHYTIDLAGGGQMTVNASSQQAAIENAKAEGGTPATA